jgi:hypothetical protein
VNLKGIENSFFQFEIQSQAKYWWKIKQMKLKGFLKSRQEFTRRD